MNYCKGVGISQGGGDKSRGWNSAIRRNRQEQDKNYTLFSWDVSTILTRPSPISAGTPSCTNNTCKCTLTTVEP